MGDNNNSGEQAKFNPALAYLEGIVKLINASDYYFMTGEYSNLFRVLKRIFIRVKHRFSETEISEIQTKFNFISPIVAKFPKTTRVELNDLAHTLEVINTLLLDYMNKYGLLIPSNKDLTKSIVDL